MEARSATSGGSAWPNWWNRQLTEKETELAKKTEDILGPYNEKLINEASEAVRIDPASPQAHYVLGEAYRAAHRFSEALAPYKEAIRLRPDYSVALYGIGECFNELASREVRTSRTNYFEAALSAYKQAIRLNPDFGEAHLGLGTAYEKLDRVAEAIAEFKIAIGIKPEYGEAYYKLGNAYLWSARWDKIDHDLAYDQLLQRHGDELNASVRALKEAIRLTKWPVNEFLTLGGAYQLLEQYDQAIGVYKQSIEISPGSWGLPYEQLNETYLESGRAVEGVESYRKMIRQRPDDAFAHYALGRLSLEIGDKVTALEAYKSLTRLKAEPLAQSLINEIYK